MPKPPTARISVRTEELSLPLTSFPDAAKLQEEVKSWENRYSALVEQGATEWELGPLHRFCHWARLRMATAANGTNPAIVTFSLQEIMLGDLRFCAMPFETMAETRYDLVDALGADTIPLGFTNGLVAYLPTPEISAEGGMEAKLGYKAYFVPSEIPGDWEPIIRKWFSKSA